uniref:Uncharacterized protein n=1 Tax=Anopheles farauti TaxID=69004 RepID=A0A182Q8S9_9DIPT
MVTLPSPSGPPAPSSLGQRRWRRRLREAGRANAGPPHLPIRPQNPPDGGPVDDKMKYLTAGHRESYTLVARKRMVQSREHLYGKEYCIDDEIKLRRQKHAGESYIIW